MSAFPHERFPRLAAIESPADLRRLPEAELPAVAAELRGYLIETLARIGGHFAANLGTVELTVALHYVFDTPTDRLVWDVGHQAYAHKVLTGRRDALDTIRRQGGLAPFPSRDESEFDTFGVGHSSTSVSAALGMAIALAASAPPKGGDARGEDSRVVAVIGDGAMTAGMAFEALNHGGALHPNLLVVLNDNDMSISENVGGLSNYFAKLLSGKTYYKLREGSKKVLAHMPTMWELARRSEEHVKGMVFPGTMFEELGWNYLGPIDGHDLDTLVTTLRNLRNMHGPQFLHVVTRKGKGFAPAEADPIKYHGPSSFDPVSGAIPVKAAKPTYSEVFGQWLCDAAEREPKLMAITPAMREGSGLVEYSQRFPERYFDVGIAEQHAVTLAAGMACEGLKPVVAIYSTFLQRAYDQLVHDVAVQDLPVTFAIDRAGVVGPDGATHAGSFDLAFLRCLPNMVVMAPADEDECRRMLDTALDCGHPAAVRYPRGAGIGMAAERAARPLPVGKAELRRRGRELLIVGVGAMVPALGALAEELDATLLNLRFVKPLDEALLLELARSHARIVTVEDGCVAGGAGSAVGEALAAHGLRLPLLQLGLPDRFLAHGSRDELLTAAGLDPASLRRAVLEFVGPRVAAPKAAG
jgi:1-deoxy-D-xylulose-5-phosphate synthase